MVCPSTTWTYGGRCPATTWTQSLGRLSTWAHVLPLHILKHEEDARPTTTWTQSLGGPFVEYKRWHTSDPLLSRWNVCNPGQTIQMPPNPHHSHISISQLLFYSWWYRPIRKRCSDSQSDHWSILAIDDYFHRKGYWILLGGFIQIKSLISTDKTWPFIPILWRNKIDIYPPSFLTIMHILLQMYRESVCKEFIHINTTHSHFLMFGVMVLNFQVSCMNSIQSNFFHVRWLLILLSSTGPVPKESQCYLHYSRLTQVMIIHVYIQEFSHSSSGLGYSYSVLILAVLEYRIACTRTVLVLMYSRVIVLILVLLLAG